MHPSILALDLEGTLISNAVSQIARPGLFSFLEWCRTHSDRQVMFTTVPETVFRGIAALLVKEGEAPHWFADMEYIAWEGPTKDLRYVSGDMGAALLVDDHQPYVHPGQESLWVEAPLFAAPYAPEDNGLELVRQRLEGRISASDLA